MNIISTILVVAIALLHFGFMLVEIVLWDKPTGMRIFRLTPEFAKASKTLAANQGLYNGFLAVGLLWGAILGNSGDAIQILFLCCVIIAGIFGAFTADIRIFFIQAMPAIAALASVLLQQIF